ncbi:MAG TPA: tetratricopeptide repeat protein [Firmicutes bacterium]|nr:tetratricopeptide repeat protein [Bacillota bacterium]
MRIVKSFLIIGISLVIISCGGKYQKKINQGRQSLKNDKVMEAIGYFEQAIKDNPGSPEGYYWLGMANKARMRYGDFVINMNKALIYGGDKERKRIADAYYGFARELEAANRLDSMYDAFEHIIDIMPEYKIGDDYAIHLGNKYFDEKFDYQKALAFYVTGFESDDLPDAVKQTVLYRISRCYYEVGDYENANRSYNRLLDLFPNHPKKQIIYFDIGNINYKLAEQAYKNGRYEDAVQRGEVVLRIGKPKIWISDVQRIMGDSYLKMGEREKAVALFQAIIKDDPYQKQRNTLYALSKLKELE